MISLFLAEVAGDGYWATTDGIYIEGALRNAIDLIQTMLNVIPPPILFAIFTPITLVIIFAFFRVIFSLF